METLHQSIPDQVSDARQHWLKVYLKDPYAVKFLGPFSSPETAQSAQEQLDTEGQTMVSCFQIAPPSNPVAPYCPMSHTQWLQGLMEDYLHVKVS